MPSDTAPVYFVRPLGFRAATRAVLMLVAVGVFVGGSARGLWRPAPLPSIRADAPPPDPRRTYKGPYRNIHPDVKYVGDAVCADCHKTEADGFHRHPMSRSLVPMSQLAASQRYGTETHNPFAALRSRFTVERRGDKVWHRQERLGPEDTVLASAKVEAQYAIGSGRRGHSYLTARGGFLFQTPIGWFSQQKIWDLSAGLRSGALRPVVAGCVFCHAGGARPVADSENCYEQPIFTQAAIGCERCHGPGEVHVKTRRAGQRPRGRIDYTIVNPRSLTPDLRENVCQQCHLQGIVRVTRRDRSFFDYRPGLPLEQFWRVYVAAEALVKKRRALGPVEQMYRSKCFQASKGRLGCATCHDPHEAPPSGADRIASYRNKCLSCHQAGHPCSLDRDTRLKQSKEDSCIVCHMARLRSDDIIHTATADHSIPRQARPRQAARAPGQRPPVLPDQPLIPFHKVGAGEAAEADRDLALALARAAQERGGVYRKYVPRAVRLLEKAAEKHPRDRAVLDSLGEMLDLQGHKKKALATYEVLLRLAPRYVPALRKAALLSRQLGKFDTSLRYWEKLALATPWDPEAHFNRGVLLARAKQYEPALAACRKLLERDPLRAEAYVIRSHCLAKLGKQAEAAAARKKAVELKTPASERFRAEFAHLAE